MKKFTRLASAAPIAEVREAIAAHTFPVGQLDRIVRELPELKEIVPGWGHSLAELIDQIDDSFVIDDGWVGFPNLKTAKEKTVALLQSQANPQGVVEFDRLVEQTDLEEEELREWLAQCGFMLLSEHVLTKSRSLPEKAAGVLSIQGRAMSTSEIFDAVGQGRTVRSLGNALAASDRVARVGAELWGLQEWGLEKYTNLTDAIERRVQAAEKSGEAEFL